MNRSSQPNFGAPRTTSGKPAPPHPPKTGRNGGAKRPGEISSETQPVASEHFAATTPIDESDLLHHMPDTSGDAPNGDESLAGVHPAESASASDETNWGDVDEFIAEAQAAEAERARRQGVAEQTATKTVRRNTPLTRSEEDQVLLLVMQGFSLREAAAAIGVHHSTVTKRAKRDEDFADAIARARQKARTDPLHAVREASKRSWRAAAWLVNYLDRRDNRGRQSEKEKDASGERKPVA